MRFITGLYCAVVLSSCFVNAQIATLRIERALSLDGPWTEIKLPDAAMDADGNPRVPMTSSNEFFRTRLEIGPAVGLGDKIALQEVPSLIRTQAMELLSKRIRLSGDAEGWPEGAELAPLVLPMHGVDKNGSAPGYFEFKVVGPKKPALPKGPLPTAPDSYVQPDCGYIVMSGTSDDFPVCEFATEGPSLSDTLARAAGTSRIRVVRYGPGLAVAEDEAGGIVASLGSVPFKLGTNVLGLGGLEWRGNDITGTDESPKVVPAIATEPYESYAAFKKDLVTNPVYEELRRIKRARARLEWDVLNGVGPAGITVNLGETVRVFADLPVLPLPQVSVVSDTENFLSTSVSSTGGIRITGTAVGHGLFRARTGSQERVLSVRVVRATAPASTAQIVDSAVFYAGDWSMQPKYHQLEDAVDWSPVVGCGPVAWAMLFAWFDRHWGVEYAFRGEGSGVPPLDAASTANRVKVRPAYGELHEVCDVICAGGSGATWPPDMTEGFKGYTYISALGDLIDREWHINAETGTWPEAGALRCRDAIKKGYPAVVGLGWYWHYTLAYGYAYEVWDLGGGYTVTSRYLKCNMGWGPNVSPRWYNMLDTFYAADVKLTRGPKG